MTVENDTKDKKNILNIILFIILFLILGTVSFASFYKINISEIIRNRTQENNTKKSMAKLFEKSNNNSVVLEYNPETSLDFTLYEGQIVIASFDGLYGYYTDGSKGLEIVKEMQEPSIMANEDIILCTDIEKNSVFVVKNDIIILEKVINTQIINVSLEDEIIILLRRAEEKGYSGIVELYDLDGNNIFTRKIAQEYVPFSAGFIMSSNGKILYIHGIDITSIEVNSVIQFFNLSESKEPYSSLEFEDMLLPSILTTSEDKIFMVGGSEYAIVNSRDGSKSIVNVDNSIITAACSYQDKYLVLGLLDKHGYEVLKNERSIVEVLDLNGRVVFDFTVDYLVKGIRSFKDILVIYTDREVYFLNKKGELIDKYFSMLDIAEVIMIHKKEAIVITDKRIDHININTAY